MAMALSVLVLAADSYTFSALANGKSNLTVKPQSEITVTLVVEKDDESDIDLYSLQDYLVFDPEYLRYESAVSITDDSAGFTSNVFKTSIVNLTGKPDRLYISRASTTNAIKFGSSFTAVTVTFTAIKEGVTTISHDTIEMLDKDRNKESITSNDAKITIRSSTGGNGTVSIKYSINIDENIENGKVECDEEASPAGETIFITPTPANGYKVSKVTVINKNDKQVNVLQKDGKYFFTMPNSSVTVYAEFVVDPDYKKTPFEDVPNDEYYTDAVEWAASNNITTGTSDTTFSPEFGCTRAQIVTFLWRVAGCPKPKTSNMPFEDVTADMYYYDAVLWAMENKITKGTSDTTFSPDDTCTRAQCVTFLWRIEDEPKADTPNPFKDISSDEYYYDAVLWAVKHQITLGTSATTFSPDDTCSRAQIVTFLFRFSI